MQPLVEKKVNNFVISKYYYYKPKDDDVEKAMMYFYLKADENLMHRDYFVMLSAQFIRMVDGVMVKEVGSADDLISYESVYKDHITVAAAYYVEYTQSEVVVKTVIPTEVFGPSHLTWAEYYQLVRM